MLIGQVASFYGLRSGGLRRSLDAVAAGYAAHGHRRLLVVPGPADAEDHDAAGRRVWLRSPVLPRSGGYRILRSAAVRVVLDEAGLDRLELSDRTMPGLARWAARRAVPTVLWAHERLDGILAARAPRAVPLPRLVDHWNRKVARSVDAVVCSSDWAAAEWRRIGVEPAIVPLGVDLGAFSPNRRAPPAAGTPADPWRLVSVGRLSAEKRPDLAIDTLGALRRRGAAAVLTMVGDGPLRAKLVRRSAGLPVRFTGHLEAREEVAAELAGADVALAPCPVETFGLGVLEALACGTPVVAPAAGAAPELLAGGAGRTSAPDGPSLAQAVLEVLAEPPAGRRLRARRAAEGRRWEATVEAMLALHQLPGRPSPVRLAG